MSVREWLNNNSTVATSAAVVALVVALGVLFLQQRGPAHVPPRNVYFWDMETNEPFVERINTVPPIEAPSGGRGVRAHLYTCGECTPGEWFGYLETFTDEAKRMYEEEGVFPEGEEDMLVRALNGGRWVPLGRDDVADTIYDPCPNDPENFPRECLP